jgi:hypothetical protein
MQRGELEYKAAVMSDRESALEARAERLAAELKRARAILGPGERSAQHRRVARLERDLLACVLELRQVRREIV